LHVTFCCRHEKIVKTYNSHRDLQLEDHNASVLGNQIPSSTFLLLLSIRIVSSRREHDPVLPRLLLNNDIRRARRLAFHGRHTISVDPFLAQSLEVVLAETIIANVADHGHFRALGSEASACHCLVGAFASESG
jgi:hypothetical protein